MLCPSVFLLCLSVFSVAVDVVVLGAVLGEVEFGFLEDAGQVGQSIDHRLTLAKFVRVVKVGRFFLDFIGKGEVRFRSFDLGTGRWIFAGIRSCVQ